MGRRNRRAPLVVSSDVKRTLASLAALLAAGLTLVIPGARTDSGTSRPVARADASLAPGTFPATAPHTTPSPEGGSPRWTRRLDGLVKGVPISVAVLDGGRIVYHFRPATPRVPASNEKLLLSMALLSALGPEDRVPTTANATNRSHGVVRGDLWLEGAGDPTITSGDLARLARRIRAARVRRITGSVKASVEPFGHDWSAPGWKPKFRREQVALPTALTFEGNTIRGRHVRHPERFASESLLKHLRKLGVKVDGRAATGHAPTAAHEVASITSPPLLRILHQQDVDSVNFFAEVLNKLLGYSSPSREGTIAGGAAAIQAWAAAQGVELEAHDGSGLSYANRVSAAGMVELLQIADASPWGPPLRSSLPHPGQGTLSGRLSGVKLRAKTGTLHIASALSGWIWLKHGRDWAPFSILVGNIDTDRAIALEDQIVRILSKSARPPAA
jgi:serine-type D-Ala-D-Ala carboxypeptidase/endopeptidase (penicillin-binding protein 4)